MGWNNAYTQIERQVIQDYDAGYLNEQVLLKILEPFRGCDVDHGGHLGLRTQDGLFCDEVILKIVDPFCFEAINLEYALKNEDYYEEISDVVGVYLKNQFGFW